MGTNYTIESIKNKILDRVQPEDKGIVNDLLKELTKGIIDLHFNELRSLSESLHKKAIRDL